MTETRFAEYLAALLVPPLAVFWAKGAGRDFWFACLLTLLGYLPGVGFALITLLKPEPKPVAA